MLTILEFHHFLVRGRHDHELAERVLTVLGCAAAKVAVGRLATLAQAGLTLRDDIAFFKYAHDRYLPVCALYLRQGYPCDPSFARFRQERARLGGVSRWMYAHQRQTFRDALKLLPFASEMQPWMVDWLWRHVVELERHQLARAGPSAAQRRRG